MFMSRPLRPPWPHARYAPHPKGVRKGARAFSILKDIPWILRFVSPRGDIQMFRNIANLLNDEAGATAIEYGLIAALIAVAAIAAMTAVGTALTTTFNNIAGKV
jgi:pilus assembly protein Flp/PilA